MKEVKIRLNFFALENQDIFFKVFRQEYTNQTKQEGYSLRKLPKTSTTENEYIRYWVTFYKADGFEEFKCKAFDNPYLTLDIMWQALLANINTHFSNKEYVLTDRGKFNRHISIIMKKYDVGNEVITIRPYYLKGQKKFGFITDFRFRKNEDVAFSKRIQQLSLSLDKNYNSNMNYYSDKYDKVMNSLKQLKDRLFPLDIQGIKYGIQSDLYSMNPYYLKTKAYVFGNNKASNSQYNGLKENGPLKLIERPPFFVYIFQDNQRDLANEVYKALSGSTFPSVFSGMEKMFGVQMSKENVTRININSYNKNDLEKIEAELSTLLEKYADKQIIGVFIEPSKEVFSDAEFSPYYYLKYIFTKKHIPLQAITIERIKGKNGLKWLASGLGLQLFAKMGGIPWKVEPSNDNCLIFGLGSAHKIDKNGYIKKYFAYSICMDSSGIYKKLDVLGEGDSENSYLSELKENIKSVLLTSIDTNINKCAIHLPFKIKKKEIQSIKDGVNEICTDNKKIEFVFIKINTKNEYFGYAENNSKVPYESSYLRLSGNEYLVWFEGLQYGKENISKRIGNPVHIEFMDATQNEEEKRHKYLQDIINLSGANWRGFNAKLSPISIYYPEIIAGYISEFRKFSEENDVDISNIQFPWFL